LRTRHTNYTTVERKLRELGRQICLI
jgi:hypothetical protein